MISILLLLASLVAIGQTVELEIDVESVTLPNGVVKNIYKHTRAERYFMIAPPLTWFEAKEMCSSMDARLAVVKSAEQQLDIELLVDGVGSENGWLGLHRNSTTCPRDVWQWIDGTCFNPVQEFSGWAPGQNENKGGREKCASLVPQGLWHDIDCALLEGQGAVCEHIFANS